MAKAAYYTVAESFVGTLDGAEVEYHKGEVVDVDDPALAKWPHQFVQLVVREHRRMVEQATAAPGEQRGHALSSADFRPARRGV
jgi:hypothetical protein